MVKNYWNMFRVLMKVKSEKCAQCGRKFDNQRELNGHILSVHEGKKGIQMSYLQSCFAEASKLKRPIEHQTRIENLQRLW